MIESLEVRRLLAQLTIDGITDAAKPDNITLKLLSTGNVQVVNGGTAAIKVNGASLAAGQTSSKSGIDKVLVNLSAGNDKFSTDGNVNAKITVNGGAGNDTVTGSKNADSLLGNDGNDNFDAGSGNDFIDGGAGNDTAAGGKGSDTILGGIGNDLIGGGDDGDILYGDNRNFNYTEDGSDRINGGNGLDFIIGEGKADTLNGDNDNDIFSNIDGAADSINGGAGIDTCAPDSADIKTNVETQNSIVNAQNLNGSYAEVSGTSGNDAITVDASGGLLFITMNGQTRVDSIARLTQLGEGQVLLGIEVRGGAGNDTITINSGVGAAVGAPGNNQSFVGIYGDAGNDIIKASEPAYLGGGLGNDSITGTSSNDIIIGGSGNDTVKAGGGRDIIAGDGGDGIFTSVDVSAGNIVDPFDIPDLVNTRSGILGSAGNDNLRGEDGDEIIHGGDGNDTIDGGQGNDAMLAGGGIDTSDWADRIVNLIVTLDGVANDGGPGGTDNVGADFENIIGGTKNDRLTGNALTNNIDGRAGNDTIFGLAGNDTLTGGTGNDNLDGGDGDDRFFNKDSSADTVFGGNGFDTAAIDALDSLNVEKKV